MIQTPIPPAMPKSIVKRADSAKYITRVVFILYLLSRLLTCGCSSDSIHHDRVTPPKGRFALLRVCCLEIKAGAFFGQVAQNVTEIHAAHAIIEVAPTAPIDAIVSCEAWPDVRCRVNAVKSVCQLVAAISLGAVALLVFRRHYGRWHRCFVIFCLIIEHQFRINAQFLKKSVLAPRLDLMPFSTTHWTFASSSYASIQISPPCSYIFLASLST